MDRPTLPKNLTLDDVSMEELELIGRVLLKIKDKVRLFEETWTSEQARLSESIATIEDNLKQIAVAYEDEAEEEAKGPGETSDSLKPEQTPDQPSSPQPVNSPPSAPTATEPAEESSSPQNQKNPNLPRAFSRHVNQPGKEGVSSKSGADTGQKDKEQSGNEEVKKNWLTRLVTTRLQVQGADLLFLMKAKKDNAHRKYAPVPPEIFYAENARINCVQRIREYIYFTMHDENYSTLSYFIFILVMALIMTSTVTFVLETIPSLRKAPVWDTFETVISIAFTVEYVLRIVNVRRPWAYFCEILNFIDFLAVMPYYLEQFLGIDGGFLRMIRVVRLTRLSRLRKSAMVSDNTEVLQNTLIKTMEAEFGVIFSLILLEVLVMSALIYAFERDDNPQFFSIPAAMWWCFVTITTVGYGDMAPSSAVGQIVGVLTALSGVVVVAIIIIIITSNFNAIYKDYTIAKRKKAHRLGNRKHKRNATNSRSTQSQNKQASMLK